MADIARPNVRLAMPEEAKAWLHLEPDLLIHQFPTILVFWWDDEGRAWVETDETRPVETPTAAACPLATDALTAFLEGGWEALTQKAPRLACGCCAVIQYEAEAETLSCLFVRRADHFTAEFRLAAADVLAGRSFTTVVQALQSHPHDEATFRRALHTLNSTAPQG